MQLIHWKESRLLIRPEVVGEFCKENLKEIDLWLQGKAKDWERKQLESGFMSWIEQ